MILRITGSRNHDFSGLMMLRGKGEISEQLKLQNYIRRKNA